jgi:hypothetical protein
MVVGGGQSQTSEDAAYHGHHTSYWPQEYQVLAADCNCITWGSKEVIAVAMRGAEMPKHISPRPQHLSPHSTLIAAHQKKQLLYSR